MDDDIALGMIETKGLVGLIEAADAAVKAAKIEIVNYEKSGGGLTIVKFRGTVGAVKSAVEAGALAAQRVGELISSHIIPSPHSDVEPMINPLKPPTTRIPSVEFHNWEKPAHSSKEVKKKKVSKKISPSMKVVADPSDKKLNGIVKKLEEIGLSELTFNELRYLARRVENFPMDKGEIRDSTKTKLIEAFKKVLG